jgi:hypothetical protein
MYYVDQLTILVICVEFKCRGKASGIETSKAKWFVTYFKYLNEIWFFKKKP